VVLVVSVCGIDWLLVSGFAMDVSAGAAVVVVSYPLFTDAESPRSGAAPVSSDDRLWQAAKVAAAARIQSVFMFSPSGDPSPARRGPSSPMFVSLRACVYMTCSCVPPTRS
jgi:hypothetical protein